MADLLELEEGEAVKVTNMDVASLCDRLARYGYEIIKSQSSIGTGNLNIADVGRWGTYLDRIDAMLDNYSVPPLDLPKSHPNDHWRVRGFPTNWEAVVENNSVRDVVRRIRAMHTELVNSTSKDQSSGIGDHDVTRLKAITANTRNLLEITSPAIDMPEQSADINATHVAG